MNANHNFKFSRRSELNLIGIHPDLEKVIRHALRVSEIDFSVIEGLRTQDRQKQLFNQGKSKTLKSRHLTGHAVDLAPLVNGVIPWNHWPYFEKLAMAVKLAARTLGISIIWGGDWTSFKDGPHFELPKKNYP